MPIVHLARGHVGALEVHHFATGVRIIVVNRDDGKLARVVLSHTERDALIAALTGPAPELASFEELVERQDFVLAARQQIHALPDAEDRIQDTICQVWGVVTRRRARGRSTDRRLIFWLFRRRLLRTRTRFVGAQGRRGLDALDPRVRHILSVDPSVLVHRPAMSASPEDHASLRELLSPLSTLDTALLTRPVTGETLDEIVERTGHSRSMLHRHYGELMERCRAA